MRYFREAAEHGHPDAQFEMFVRAEDTDEALDWLYAAWENGSSNAAAIDDCFDLRYAFLELFPIIIRKGERYQYLDAVSIDGLVFSRDMTVVFDPPDNCKLPSIGGKPCKVSDYVIEYYA